MASKIEDTLEERENNYGNFKTHAGISQNMLGIAKKGSGWEKMSATQKEGFEMIVHKLARLANGNPNHLDSWHDIAGYATLVEQITDEGMKSDLKFEPVHVLAFAKVDKKKD